MQSNTLNKKEKSLIDFSFMFYEERDCIESMVFFSAFFTFFKKLVSCLQCFTEKKTEKAK